MDNYISLKDKITSIEKTVVTQTDFLECFKALESSMGDRKKFNTVPRISDETQLSILIKSSLALLDLQPKIKSSQLSSEEKAKLLKHIRWDIRFFSSVMKPGVYDEEKYK